MNRRQHIQPGYRSFTGHIWNQDDCDAYNRIQDRINAFLDDGRAAPAEILNASFNTFNAVCMIPIPRKERTYP